ncbi:MAG: phytanoyl-CoA dioxygenase family protein [Bacteroidetes bacterium]|nr:phytanoyl-CoA dioxygenase family protein [Bacteroidota bacterium]
MDNSISTTYRPIFKDALLEEQFTKLGYLRIKLLQPDEICEILDLYDKHEVHVSEGGFYSTIQNPSEEKKQLVSDRLNHIIGNAVKKMAGDYYPLFSNFLVKHPKNKHQVGIHQDWSYVDETRFRSFNVWVSLVASGEWNGGMYILPGSHNVKMPIRSTPFDSSIYDRYRKKIERNSIGLSLNPGEALVYDARLIHYSTRNSSRFARKACGSVFVTKESQPKHYFEKDGQLYEYNADSSFFSKIIPGEFPGEDYVRVSAADKHYDKASFANLFE